MYVNKKTIDNATRRHAIVKHTFIVGLCTANRQTANHIYPT